jgi:hypothetical protein
LADVFSIRQAEWPIKRRRLRNVYTKWNLTVRWESGRRALISSEIATLHQAEPWNQRQIFRSAMTPLGALTARLSGVPWKPARQIAVTETYTVTHSPGVSKIPRLHSRSVRSNFRNGRSLRHSSSNLIRSAERDSDGFLKLESLDFFETPSPTKIGSEKRNQKPGN